MLEGEKPTITATSNGSKDSLELMIKAQESERQRLSRQMHDGPAQALSNFILQTEIAMRLFDINQVQAKEELTNLKMAAMNTFQKVRSFIFELRPMMLDDLGLIPTIRRYIDTFKEQTGIETTFVISGVERRLEPYLEVMIFRAVQELMGNVVKHAQANRIKVQFILDDNSVKISIDDNGKGFTPETSTESGGLGLNLIRERVGMLGGTVEIDSVLGQGSKIMIQVPTAQF
jgi:two-component system sensor histidine kinase DegS